MNTPDEVRAIKEAVKLIREMGLVDPHCLRAIVFEEILNRLDTDDVICDLNKLSNPRINRLEGSHIHGNYKTGGRNFNIYARDVWHNIRGPSAFRESGIHRYSIAGIEYNKEEFEKIINIINV